MSSNTDTSSNNNNNNINNINNNTNLANLSNSNTNNSFIPFSKPQRRVLGDRQIKFRCFLQNTILDVLKGRGWQEITE
jgi:hypothetical protein